jgi:hemerythrin
MALIQWNNNLSVGIAEIDGQHQRLVKLINDLNDAMKVGKGKEITGKILNELTSYTLNHFATEEKYFDKFNYPESVAHKDEHSKFVQKVSAFKNDFEESRVSITIPIMNFLSDWLKNHIAVIDKKYQPFLTAQGLK